MIFLNPKNELMQQTQEILIPLVIGIILAIWFATGIFPIKPVAIATGSMEKELFAGDVAIIKKCNSNDIVVGDIIEYQIIHPQCSKQDVITSVNFLLCF